MAVRTKRRFKVRLDWGVAAHRKTRTVMVWTADARGAVLAAKANTGLWGAETTVTAL